MRAADIRIAPLAPADHADWQALYRGYADFYRQPMDEEILSRVWRWLQEGRLCGFIARDASGAPAGIAHVEYILRPLQGKPLAYLHDLFVDLTMRRMGAGAALLRHAGTEAAKRGCAHMRWLTKADNAAARALYDKHAQAANVWTLYQQDLAARDAPAAPSNS